MVEVPDGVVENPGGLREIPSSLVPWWKYLLVWWLVQGTWWSGENTMWSDEKLSGLLGIPGGLVELLRHWWSSWVPGRGTCGVATIFQ